MATVAEALAVAVGHHAAGNLAEAEGIYRRILAVEPANADALHLLGLIAHQVGRYDLAVDLIGQAVAGRPDFAAAHGNLGAALKELGRLDQAVVSQRTAVALDPGFFEAYCNLAAVLTQLERADEALAAYGRAVALNPDGAELPTVAYNLGVVLERLGRLDEAVAVYAKAVALAPDLVPAHYNLGNALSAVGRLDDAVASYERAIALDPCHAEAHTNLGNALQKLRRFTDAVACYENAIAVRPDFAMAYNNLGNAWKELTRLDDAADAYRAALAVHPDHAEAHNGLGTVLYANCRYDEAIQHYEMALSLNPDLAETYNNLGQLYAETGLRDKAAEYFDAALELQPDLAMAHDGRAHMHFTRGDLIAAWEDYEWRLKLHGRQFVQPRWNGQALYDETLLIWGEQGLGDEIQGIGMLPDAMNLAKRCVVECEPRLVEVFARSFPAASFVPRTDPPHPEALAADYQVPLFSLGRFFRRTVDDFPDYRGGYLVPDPAKVKHWAAWLATLEPGLKIGLSWKSRMLRDYHWRSFAPLDLLSIILRVPGVVFVALQYDDIAADVETMWRAHGVRVQVPEGIDLTNDIDGVAALAAALDGVVGPMGAVGVLSGAVGRAAWVYLNYPAYGTKTALNLDYVPWCPSVALAKKGYSEDWTPALTRIAADLRGLGAKG